jgi:cysteine dioxygenase
MKDLNSSNALALLVEVLRATSVLNRDRIEKILRSAKIDIADVGPFIQFSENYYTRNLVFGNERFQVLILCWNPSQGSQIHGHGQSACGVKVIAGTATEASFHAMTDSHPYRTQVLTATDVVAGNSDHIHQVTNASNDPLITLHVYSPPLVVMPTV